MVVFFLIIAFILHRRRLRTSKYISKPDKPWEIPEEKAYLDKLVKEDKDKYNKVLKMMEDEYKSSLLWYNDYVKTLTQPKLTKQKKVKKEKPKKEKIKPILTKKEKEAMVYKKPEEKPVEEPIIEKSSYIEADKKEKAEDLRKQKLIAKIKKKEEKQKRKFKK
jgi:hypothetical protein